MAASTNQGGGKHARYPGNSGPSRFVALRPVGTGARAGPGLPRAPASSRRGDGEDRFLPQSFLALRAAYCFVAGSSGLDASCAAWPSVLVASSLSHWSLSAPLRLSQRADSPCVNESPALAGAEVEP